MEGVVPAAGRGTRLRPLTDDRPKGLLDVGGRPLLTRCFDRLVEVGVSELVVVVGYRGDRIVSRYGESFGGTPITYVWQPDPRGLGDAVRRVAPAVGESFVVLNGDNVFASPPRAPVRRHRSTDAAATLLVETVPREAATGTGAVVTDGDGRVTRMVEKPEDPPSTLVSAGCSVLSPVALEACRIVTPSARGEYELADAVDLLCRAGHRVEAVELEGDRVNVNTAADLERAERLL